jgi:hypothetical protein
MLCRHHGRRASPAGSALRACLLPLLKERACSGAWKRQPARTCGVYVQARRRGIGSLWGRAWRGYSESGLARVSGSGCGDGRGVERCIHPQRQTESRAHAPVHCEQPQCLPPPLRRRQRTEFARRRLARISRGARSGCGRCCAPMALPMMPATDSGRRRQRSEGGRCCAPTRLLPRAGRAGRACRVPCVRACSRAEDGTPPEPAHRGRGRGAGPLAQAGRRAACRVEPGEPSRRAEPRRL